MQNKVSKGNLGMTAKILLAAATLLVASGLNLGATSVALAKTYTYNMNSDTGTAQTSTATTATSAGPSPNSDGYIRPNISEAGIAEVDGVTFPFPMATPRWRLKATPIFSARIPISSLPACLLRANTPKTTSSPCLMQTQV